MIFSESKKFSKMASWFGDIKKKLQDTVNAIEQQMKVGKK